MAQRRLVILALLLCVLAGLLPPSVQAASTTEALEPISPNQKCVLTLNYRHGDTNFEGIPVKVYRIAEVSADFQYTLTSAFAESGVILNGVQSSSEWNVIRSTLESYIVGNRITPTLAESTDQAGQVHFYSVSTGMYLVAAAETVTEAGTYIFNSTLIALPSLGADGRWQYQVSASPKPDLLPPIGPDEKEEFRVIKLWKGDEGKNSRPASVTVEIFRNGVSYETVTLSATNLWTYSWTADKDHADWSVVERNVPAGYRATVDDRTTTFLVTNTWKPDDSDDIIDPPKTGDTSNVLLYVLLMFLSGSLLVILGMAEKRRAYEKS